MRAGGKRALGAAMLAPTVLAAALAGCGGGGTARTVPGANPGRGAELISYDGCGSCHQISGIDGADGRVGPPLDGFGGRRYIVGRLTNTPAHLEQWIEDPQRFLPRTIMPDLGVKPTDARDMAAYLLAH